ncbi:replication factor C small subunit [Candidatus Woesearchaeota archaeon]|nr:replication factor C small subunit [Candidatus Woesearchaeota archaeon]MBW3013721.1 replication factor C small subunit [Candidatus Woesearchaeota archaeon]
MENIWTEKYRPSKFEEVKGQKEIVSRVKAFVENKNMPHLLFSGPAGVGKTTLALVIAKQMFGDNWKANVLELNASDERGIDVIRVNVKNFARMRAIDDVPFKIIYLDECDALTKEAQQALRRTMENYTKTCRFVLSCNYASKIIDPIKSRCAVFKFLPLDKEDIFEVIDKIAKEEKISVDEKTKLALFEASNGDCRKVENIMQSCAAISNTINEDTVFAIASTAKPKEIAEIITLAVNGKFTNARDKLLKTMQDYGLSGIDIIKQITKEVWGLNVDDRKKIHMIDTCGECEFRIVEGSDEFIQLEALLAKFGMKLN